MLKVVIGGQVIDVQDVCNDAGDEYGHQLIIMNIDKVIEAGIEAYLENTLVIPQVKENSNGTNM